MINLNLFIYGRLWSKLSQLILNAFDRSFQKESISSFERGLREERSQTYPYIMLSAKQGSTWYHFYNVFSMTPFLGSNHRPPAYGANTQTTMIQGTTLNMSLSLVLIIMEKGCCFLQASPQALHKFISILIYMYIRSLLHRSVKLTDGHPSKNRSAKKSLDLLHVHVCYPLTDRCPFRFAQWVIFDGWRTVNA